MTLDPSNSSNLEQLALKGLKRRTQLTQPRTIRVSWVSRVIGLGTELGIVLV